MEKKDDSIKNVLYNTLPKLWYDESYNLIKICMQLNGFCSSEVM